MFKTLLKAVAVVLAIAVVAAIGAYAIGLRIVLDGAGSPRLQFEQSEDDRAATIARHREAQRTETPPAPAAVPEPVHAGAPPAVDSVAPGPPATTATPASASDPTGSAYWTGFRGPHRDGHYQQQPLRTAWPETGLTPLWKQPVGAGYASFVAANGHAFTIE